MGPCTNTFGVKHLEHVAEKRTSEAASQLTFQVEYLKPSVTPLWGVCTWSFSETNPQVFQKKYLHCHLPCENRMIIYGIMWKYTSTLHMLLHLASANTHIPTDIDNIEKMLKEHMILLLMPPLLELSVCPLNTFVHETHVSLHFVHARTCRTYIVCTLTHSRTQHPNHTFVHIDAEKTDKDKYSHVCPFVQHLRTFWAYSCAKLI